jgi:hypothetical protein
MEKWLRAHNGTRIGRAVNISKQFLTDITMLKFNHGASSGDINWIRCGLTIMTCITYSQGVWEDLLAEEEAARTTHTRCTMDKELKRSKGTQHDPPATYGDLSLAIDTFAELLRTLFGPKCDYYTKIMNI